MGQKVSHNDFEWSYTEEPHATRRKEILAKYPEVKKLFGHDPTLKWKVTGMVIFQLVSAYLFCVHWALSWPLLLILAYLIGGVINHSMTLAIHEIAHNLAFGHSRPMANRIFGMFANLPIIVPMSVSFKKYHLLHHRYQGDNDYDMDIPSRMEGYLFRTSFTKFIWILLQPLFYSLRPLFLLPMPTQFLEVVNIGVQLTFNATIFYLFGSRYLLYLGSGTFMAMGLHPVAGHFISEHYMFKKGYETYSYYGPLNSITFNVGYHNEHHDFPSIPGTRLPQVRKIAPEFYDNLPCHTSWSRVLYDFIFDPDIGPYARVKRRIPLPTKPETNGVSNGNGMNGNGHAMNGSGHVMNGKSRTE